MLKSISDFGSFLDSLQSQGEEQNWWQFFQRKSMAGAPRPRIPISADWILKRIQKGKKVRLRNAIIEDDLDLNKLDLPTQHVERDEVQKQLGGLKEDIKIVQSSINITNSSIQGTLDFSNSIFNKNAWFNGVTFSSYTVFIGATFSEHALFNEATFSGPALFNEATFDMGAGFIAATFNKQAHFMGAAFGKMAGFVTATFREGAVFNQATFSEYAEFHGVTFNEDVSFCGATVSKDAGFNGAIFSKGANFNDAKFREDVTFLGAVFDQKFSLAEAKYDRAYIRWDTVKDHLEYQGATYITLINNFKNLGFFNDADACYYQYRRIAQNKKSWYDWSKLFDIIAWITCGYGVKVWPTAICMLGFVVVFASLYGIFEGIANVGSSGISSISINITPTVIQNAPPTTNVMDAGSPSWADYLYFSAAALTGATAAELHPIGAWKYAVVIERLLGYLFLALFVVVLTKKMIR